MGRLSLNYHTIKETYKLSNQRIGNNRQSVMKVNKCPYPGCGRERETVDDEIRRHCEGHEIQVRAVGMAG